MFNYFYNNLNTDNQCQEGWSEVQMGQYTTCTDDYLREANSQFPQNDVVDPSRLRIYEDVLFGPKRD